MKKFLAIVIILMSALPTFAAKGTIATYVIDPEKNAFEHNNLGVMYVEEKRQVPQIQLIQIQLKQKTPKIQQIQ